jgi:hypothetical protein
MATQPERSQPAEKSKTDLRRGQYTPGQAVGAKRPPTPRNATGTTREEEAMLFDEPGGADSETK